MTSWMVPPVCRLAVRRTSSSTPSSSTVDRSCPAASTTPVVTSSIAIRDDPSVAAARSESSDSINCSTVASPSPTTLRWPTDRRRDDRSVDHDDAEVLALAPLLEQHVGAELLRQLDRGDQPGAVGDPDRDPRRLPRPGSASPRGPPTRSRKARSASSNVASRPAGRRRPARSSTVRVSALSSHRRKATALVWSDRDSIVWTVRSPWVSSISPMSGSRTVTPIPRLAASSTMSCAYGLRLMQRSRTVARALRARSGLRSERAAVRPSPAT